jgi:hypothetical protein
VRRGRAGSPRGASPAWPLRSSPVPGCPWGGDWRAPGRAGGGRARRRGIGGRSAPWLIPVWPPGGRHPSPWRRHPPRPSQVGATSRYCSGRAAGTNVVHASRREPAPTGPPRGHLPHHPPDHFPAHAPPPRPAHDPDAALSPGAVRSSRPPAGPRLLRHVDPPPPRRHRRRRQPAQVPALLPPDGGPVHQGAAPLAARGLGQVFHERRPARDPRRRGGEDRLCAGQPCHRPPRPRRPPVAGCQGPRRRDRVRRDRRGASRGLPEPREPPLAGAGVAPHHAPARPRRGRGRRLSSPGGGGDRPRGAAGGGRDARAATQLSERPRPVHRVPAGAGKERETGRGSQPHVRPRTQPHVRPRTRPDRCGARCGLRPPLLPLALSPGAGAVEGPRARRRVPRRDLVDARLPRRRRPVRGPSCSPRPPDRG